MLERVFPGKFVHGQTRPDAGQQASKKQPEDQPSRGFFHDAIAHLIEFIMGPFSRWRQGKNVSRCIIFLCPNVYIIGSRIRLMALEIEGERKRQGKLGEVEDESDNGKPKIKS